MRTWPFTKMIFLTVKLHSLYPHKNVSANLYQDEQSEENKRNPSNRIELI